jgi:hypothetical protein
MTKRQRSPQEKKALSYERDRRNVYGENTAASRRGVPIRKRSRSRAERHLENDALRQSVGDPEAVVSSSGEPSVVNIDGGKSCPTHRWRR